MGRRAVDSVAFNAGAVVVGSSVEREGGPASLAGRLLDRQCPLHPR